MSSASGVRRSLAVFIDFFTYSVVWGVIGGVSQGKLGYVGLVAIFAIDLVLTALFGTSVGRWVVGIRVARVDGGRPGLVAALIRTALTFSTGWAGLVFVSVLLQFRREEGSDRGMPERLWWDAAAGTRLQRGR